MTDGMTRSGTGRARPGIVGPRFRVGSTRIIEPLGQGSIELDQDLAAEAVAGDEVASIVFMGEERRVAAFRVERKIF